jgi:hypothetical protein
MSKDAIIVTSWPTGFKNWEYDVLSHVCTLSGLYLVDEIDLEKPFKPSQQLKSYIKYAKTQESYLLKKQKNAISQFSWM